jgi:hypothetical protein
MNAGQHAAEFTVGQTELGDYNGATLMVGLARPSIDVSEANAFQGSGFWGIYHDDGDMHQAGDAEAWEGQQGFQAGDVVGMLLDCEAGTLIVKKNGKRLGVAATGLTGELCWAVCICETASVAIVSADAGAF